MARRRSESEAGSVATVKGDSAATPKKLGDAKGVKAGKAGKGGKGGGYKPRRDWSKIVFYTISVLVVLSMVLGLFASVLPNLGL